MAPVARSVKVWGGAAAGIVAALTLGPILALALIAEASGRSWGPDLAALRFTLVQAVLSAALSVLLAIPVARALARRQFPGRGLLLTLLGAPFILPVIVAVMGLLAVLGRNGWVSTALEAIGLPPVNIYGLTGVVLAHVFFNLPLATRMLLQGWLAVPSERFRLAASLDAPVGRVIEWPMLRSLLPGAFLVIFLICLSSFAVALILGGGPRATTLELAIYQSLRFEFDLGRAALLAMVQVAVMACAAALTLRFSLPDAMGGGLDRVVQRWDGTAWIDGAVIAAAAVFLLVPLSAVILRGVPGLFDLTGSIWLPVLRSVSVALAATALAMALSLCLALRGGAAVAWVSVLPLAISPLVIGTGLFIALNPVIGPGALALPLTAVVNGLLAVPFATRVLAPAVAREEAAYGRLADALALTGWARVRLVILPRLRGPLGFSAGLAAALSMGDLGVIALFAGPDQSTLPLEMYRLMGAYRSDAAAGAGLLLFALSLGLFWIFDRAGRHDRV